MKPNLRGWLANLKAIAMSELTNMIDTFTPEQNEAVLKVLDALSRPMTVREIEAHLRNRGVPRSRAVIIAASVKDMNIIAMIGGEA